MSDKKDAKPAEAPKAEAPKANAPEKKEVSAKGRSASGGKLSPSLQKIVNEVEKLTVLELSDLVKALEDKFGVSAAAPVAVAAAGAPGAAGDAPAAEEKTEFDVVLTDAGANKIAVIKAVREFKQDLGLVEAKNLVEKPPLKILENAKKEDAETAKAKLEEAGAQIELK